MNSHLPTIFAASLFLSIGQQGLACGSKEAPCHVADGEYFAVLPQTDAPQDGYPVVLYLHGYAASGALAVKQDKLTQPAHDQGHAFIAPTGQVDTLQGSHLDWGVRDGLDWARDDTLFLQSVLDDAGKRFPINRDRIVIAGYSRGGSMVWDIACHSPTLAAAYASYGGAFFHEIPDQCSGPVNLYHAHGFRDRTVPLEGNAINWFGAPIKMMDVWVGLDHWRSVMDCDAKATSSSTDGGLWQKTWESCPDGSLRMVLHDAGHGRPDRWLGDVVAWFMAKEHTQ